MAALVHEIKYPLECPKGMYLDLFFFSLDITDLPESFSYNFMIDANDIQIYHHCFKSIIAKIVHP